LVAAALKTILLRIVSMALSRPVILAALLVVAPLAAIPGAAAADLTLKEGSLEPFLGPPKLEFAQVFEGDRFPNVVVATDGSVLAVWGGVAVRRSTDGGRTWNEPVTIAPGFMGGGVTVDEFSGDVLAFVEDKHPPAPLKVYRSKDNGLTWTIDPTVIHPNSLGHVPSMHMNEHGITLRHGKHAGRLVRPSRWYARQNYPEEHFSTHYTNAIVSDDGGRSWKASEPFPEMGTGEACVVELADGRLLYNTRRHWATDPTDALWRWTAESTDGGLTWTNHARSATLPDGDEATTYGLMGGLVRLPVAGRDILVFSNIVSPRGRKGGHVWMSVDGGSTWPVRREVFAGPFAYSSLDAGRPGTPSEGWIYLLFEGGPQGGGTLARFNLAWLLEGEKTGDGTVPAWATPASVGTPHE
jgi:sialidase-1